MLRSVIRYPVRSSIRPAIRAAADDGTNAIVVPFLGQSNAGNHFLNSTGSETFKAALEAATGRDVVVIDGARGSSALLYNNEGSYTPPRFWMNDDGGFGVQFFAAIQAIQGAGYDRCNYIIWSQGEQDGNKFADATEIALYKDRLRVLFQELYYLYGCKIVIQFIGRRSAGSLYGGYQNIRQLQTELINELDYVMAGSETYQEDLEDFVHMEYATGYDNVAGYLSNAIANDLGVASNDVQGIVLGEPDSVTQSGNKIWIPYSLPDGNALDAAFSNGQNISPSTENHQIKVFVDDVELVPSKFVLYVADGTYGNQIRCDITSGAHATPKIVDIYNVHAMHLDLYMGELLIDDGGLPMQRTHWHRDAGGTWSRLF